MRRLPRIPRMVVRALFIGWRPARSGDGWASINHAWNALARSLERALEMHP
jgi:hypothetical protein